MMDNDYAIEGWIFSFGAQAIFFSIFLWDMRFDWFLYALIGGFSICWWVIYKSNKRMSKINHKSPKKVRKKK
jgi:hypothetical protein